LGLVLVVLFFFFFQRQEPPTLRMGFRLFSPGSVSSFQTRGAFPFHVYKEETKNRKWGPLVSMKLCNFSFFSFLAALLLRPSVV
jgi:hypothetical protein